MQVISAAEPKRSVAAVIPLGTFTTVSLREAWPTEDGNFTPWLAEPANIALLGAALNISLEVEAVEHCIGPFRADILARTTDDDSDGDHRVIIENQFGRTDHSHLGQILTYLAGTQAKTVVWIAETVQEDHRAAIDWLNANTADDFSFFVVEISLWRIGQSVPAPRFNVVASPNDWSRTARKASTHVGDPVARAEGQQFRLAYWTAFAEYLKEAGSTFQIGRPTKTHGSRFGISAAAAVRAFISEQRRIGVSLLIFNDPDKTAFRTLYAEKGAIERAIGEPLDWQENPGNKRTRVVLYRAGEDPTDTTRWREQHAWMLASMERFRSVFSPRTEALPAAQDEDAED
jgi:Domain of unknown function (DUF4268)